MKKYSNLLDLYYENTKNADQDSVFIYNDKFVLTYRETEALTNAIARDFIKKIKTQDGVAVIVSSDVFVKAVCAIALVKINCPFVYLQADDDKKMAAIKDKFQVAAIICDSNASDALFGFTTEEVFVYRLCRALFVEYLKHGYSKKLRRIQSREARENLPFRIQFTSGTTGEPKINILQQFDIADAVNTYRTDFIEKVGASRFAQYLSLDYAYGIDSFFGAIYNGVSVYLLEEHEKKNINCLFEITEKNNIDIIFLPSSLVNVIARTPHLTTKFPKSLKLVVASGESVHLSASFVEQIEELGICFVVAYGCSEMHLFSYSVFDYEKSNLSMAGTLFGVPCTNCELMALDENYCDLTTIGQRGTLFVKRIGKGAGEIHPLRLSNPKFVQLPDCEEVYYNTSDAVMLDENGYVFCGRNERRIKVRGYWVDLDYITQIVLEINGMISAYITTFSDEFENCCLACLYTGEVSKKEITDYLHERVQPHEIPAVFIMLEAMPLTITDKTDTSKCKEILMEYLKNNNKSLVSQMPPSTSEDFVVDTIKAICSKYCEEICDMPDSRFEDVGIDSLVFLVILCEIEETLKIRLNIESMDFRNINTLSKMIEVILNQM